MTESQLDTRFRSLVRFTAFAFLLLPLAAAIFIAAPFLLTETGVEYAQAIAAYAMGATALAWFFLGVRVLFDVIGYIKSMPPRLLMTGRRHRLRARSGGGRP